MASKTTSQIAKQCEDCAIRHRAICSALTEDELVSMNQIARRRRIPAGQTISFAADAGVAFANIVSGVVKLTKMLADGREQIVGLQFAPDFVGRAFADSNPNSAEAATDVELCSFPKADFEAILRRYPGLEHRLFSYTLDELDVARDWMLLLGRKTAREKVASFLLLLARRETTIGCTGTPDMNFANYSLPLTRADMADYLGLTLETVSRQMTKLKSEGTIELKGNREIIVPDIEALEHSSGN